MNLHQGRSTESEESCPVLIKWKYVSLQRIKTKFLELLRKHSQIY